MSARVAVALVIALALAAPAVARADAPAWTWRAGAPIVFQRLSPLGTLLVSTGDALTALDPATGAPLWARPDVRGLKAPDLEALPGTTCALLHLGEGVGGLKRRLELIDLATGTRRWDTRSLPIATVHGAFPAPQDSLLVLIGDGERGRAVTLGVDLASGAVRWRQDALFARPPRLRRVAGSGGMLFRSGLDGGMPPLFDGPDRMILWVSEDGPLALDLATGRKVWGAPVAGHVPSSASGHTPWMLVGRTLYAPCERLLLAIDAKSGLVVWHSDPPFPSVVGRMQLTPLGLVVQGSRVRRDDGGVEGQPFLDLLDPATGGSRWLRPPPDLADAGPFAVLDDTLFVVADRRLLAVALADGVARAVAPLAPRGHETFNGLEVVDGELVATSSQSTTRLSPRGETRYERYDPAPTAPAWLRAAAALDAAAEDAAALAALAYDVAALPAVVFNPAPPQPVPVQFVGAPLLTKRYRASHDAGACRVVLTRVEDEGRSGVGLLKLDKRTGEVRARLVIDDRTPDLVDDPIEGRLFLVRDDRAIEAYPF